MIRPVRGGNRRNIEQTVQRESQPRPMSQVVQKVNIESTVSYGWRH